MEGGGSDGAASLCLEKLERGERRDGGGGELLGVAMLGSGCRVGRPLSGRGRAGAGEREGVHAGWGLATACVVVAVVGAVGDGWRGGGDTGRTLPMWAM